MKRHGFAVCAAAVLAAAVGSGAGYARAQAVAAAEAGSESRVVSLRGEHARVFTAEEDRFRRSDNRMTEADLALPARVLDASGRGYYQVETPQGPVWLDRFDVVIDPPLVIKARCLSVSNPVDTTSNITRGVGEDCR